VGQGTYLSLMFWPASLIGKSFFGPKGNLAKKEWGLFQLIQLLKLE
jgi:hypothetical protein